MRVVDKAINAYHPGENLNGLAAVQVMALGCCQGAYIHPVCEDMLPVTDLGGHLRAEEVHYGYVLEFMRLGPSQAVTSPDGI